MKFTTEIPTYRPVVNDIGALQIEHVIDNPRGVELHFSNRQFAPHQISHELRQYYNPKPGDWACFAWAGRVYIVSAEIFDRDYCKVEPAPELSVDELISLLESARRRVEQSRKCLKHEFKLVPSGQGFGTISRACRRMRCTNCGHEVNA